MKSKIRMGSVFANAGWLVLLVLLAYSQSYAFDEGEIVAGVYIGDLILCVFLLMVCVSGYCILERMGKEIKELRERLNDAEEHIRDLEAIVYHLPLSKEEKDAQKVEE